MKSWSTTALIVERASVPRSDSSVTVSGISRRALAERAGDRGRAILLHGADHLAHRRDLERRHQAGQQRVDVGARHRERRRAEIEERMAERIDAIAVHVRHRAGGAHLAVAAEQRDADRIARLAAVRCSRSSLSPDEPPARTGVNPASRNAPPTSVADSSRQCRSSRAASRSDEATRPFVPALDDPATRILHVGRPIGERPRRARRSREARRASRSGVMRQLDPRLRRPRRGGRRCGGRVDHLRDRRDAGDRFLRERADGVGHRADQAAVDVDRAAAHAGITPVWRAGRLRDARGSGCAAAPARF